MAARYIVARRDWPAGSNQALLRRQIRTPSGYTSAPPPRPRPPARIEIVVPESWRAPAVRRGGPDRLLAVLHDIADRGEPLPMNAELLFRVGMDVELHEVSHWLGELERRGLIARSGRSHVTRVITLLDRGVMLRAAGPEAEA